MDTKNLTFRWLATGLLLAFGTGLFTSGQSQAGEKIKALVNILREMDIHVEGIGIVTGLNGTGDKGGKSLLKEILAKNNISLPDGIFKTNSIALVNVVADIPSNMSPNQKVDVRVATYGDASSLENGMLLKTFLKPNKDGEIFAVAYGSILIGGNSAISTHKTRGRIPANREGGAQILRPMETNVVEAGNKFTLKLKRPSFENAQNIAAAINSSSNTNPFKREVEFGVSSTQAVRRVARAIDRGTVVITIPRLFLQRKVEYIYNVLDVEVATEKRATVLLNRATNLIIMTQNIAIDPVVLSMNDYKISIGADGEQQAPQPNAQVPLVQVGKTNTSLRDLIDALNSMQAAPRDILVIVEKLYEMGALRCELIVQ